MYTLYHIVCIYIYRERERDPSRSAAFALLITACTCRARNILHAIPYTACDICIRECMCMSTSYMSLSLSIYIYIERERDCMYVLVYYMVYDTPCQCSLAAHCDRANVHIIQYKRTAQERDRDI